MQAKLREECPDGIDVYFDNVAGSRLLRQTPLDDGDEQLVKDFVVAAPGALSQITSPLFRAGFSILSCLLGKQCFSHSLAGLALAWSRDDLALCREKVARRRGETAFSQWQRDRRVGVVGRWRRR